MQAVRPAPRQFLSIQYLRALAALGVVIFHASPADNPFMVGNAGVDIFFVISGFIMWSITEERPTSPAAFIRDRLIRIAPLYWLLTTLLVVGVLVRSKLFPNLKIDLPFVVGSYLFVPMRPPGSTGADPIWPVLVQGWTLNYEMFFYVLFSACLFLRPSLRLAALSLTLLGCVISACSTAAATPSCSLSRTRSFSSFWPAFCWVFACGEACCLRGAWGYGFVALGVIVLVGCAMASVTQPRLLAWGLPAVLLVGGALVLETTGQIPQLPLASNNRGFLLLALSDPRSCHFRARKNHDAVVAVFLCRRYCRGRRRHLLLVFDGATGDGVSQEVARGSAGRSIRPSGAVIKNLIRRGRKPGDLVGFSGFQHLRHRPQWQPKAR